MELELSTSLNEEGVDFVFYSYKHAYEKAGSTNGTVQYVKPAEL